MAFTKTEKKVDIFETTDPLRGAVTETETTKLSSANKIELNKNPKFAIVVGVESSEFVFSILPASSISNTISMSPDNQTRNK